MSGSREVGIGQAFGSWTVLTVGPSKRSKRTYLCRCACGVERLVLGRELRHGESRSCGCRKGNRIAATRARIKQRRCDAIALLKRVLAILHPQMQTAIDIEKFLIEAGEIPPEQRRAHGR